MFKVSDKTRDLIFYSGAVLLLAGVAPVFISKQLFNSLPNYQRIALVIPVALASVMLNIDNYRNWSSVQVADRGRAIGAMVALMGVIIGTVIWWLTAPDARA